MISRANPKSQIFTTLPWVTSTFLAARSRCTHCREGHRSVICPSRAISHWVSCPMGSQMAGLGLFLLRLWGVTKDAEHEFLGLSSLVRLQPRGRWTGQPQEDQPEGGVLTCSKEETQPGPTPPPFLPHQGLVGRPHLGWVSDYCLLDLKSHLRK